MAINKVKITSRFIFEIAHNSINNANNNNNTTNTNNNSNNNNNGQLNPNYKPILLPKLSNKDKVS